MNHCSLSRGKIQEIFLSFVEKEDSFHYNKGSYKLREEKGFVFCYTHQCPFTVEYVPLFEATARERAVVIKKIQFQTAERAKHAPTLFTTYSLFYNGEFVTNEILFVKKIGKIWAATGSTLEGRNKKIGILRREGEKIKEGRSQ